MIRLMEFIKNIRYMGKGMLEIAVTILIIIIIVMLLNWVTYKK